MTVWKSWNRIRKVLVVMLLKEEETRLACFCAVTFGGVWHYWRKISSWWYLWTRILRLMVTRIISEVPIFEALRFFDGSSKINDSSWLSFWFLISHIVISISSFTKKSSESDLTFTKEQTLSGRQHREEGIKKISNSWTTKSELKDLYNSIIRYAGDNVALIKNEYKGLVRLQYWTIIQTQPK